MDEEYTGAVVACLLHKQTHVHAMGGLMWLSLVIKSPLVIVTQEGGVCRHAAEPGEALLMQLYI